MIALTKDQAEIEGFIVFLNNNTPSGGRWLHNSRTQLLHNYLPALGVK